MRASHHIQRQQFVETLESRQLFSASTSVLSTRLSSHLVPAATAKPAILGPSAVEGTYKGDTDGFDGAVYEVKLVLTSTSAKLTIDGLGTYYSALTAKQFIRIREGTFAVEFVGIDGAKGSAAFVGGVTDSGLRIAGNYTNSAEKSGTFVLKK